MGKKILQIGNYPPPVCGWAIQTVLLDEEFKRRGHTSKVLNVNESRKLKGQQFVDVQNGFDFAWKVLGYAIQGYQIHAHLNAESPKLYVLDAFALLVARLVGKPAVLTFHGGLPQKYFPRARPGWLRWAFQLVFRMAGRLTCDSEQIKEALVSYGISPDRIAAIPCFSVELLNFEQSRLPEKTDTFLQERFPVFLCYVSYRPEYQLPVLREGMKRFRQKYPNAGFIWLGFPGKEFPIARDEVESWPSAEKESILLLGNLPHNEFLSLLVRCFATLRTPACDGVSASVLESLSLSIPVVASENGRRPPGVITYSELNAADMCNKLMFVVENYPQIKAATRFDHSVSNTKLAADWIVGDTAAKAAEVFPQVGNHQK